MAALAGRRGSCHRRLVAGAVIGVRSRVRREAVTVAGGVAGWTRGGRQRVGCHTDRRHHLGHMPVAVITGERRVRVRICYKRLLVVGVVGIGRRVAARVLDRGQVAVGVVVVVRGPRHHGRTAPSRPTGLSRRGDLAVGVICGRRRVVVGVRPRQVAVGRHNGRLLAVAVVAVSGLGHLRPVAVRRGRRGDVPGRAIGELGDEPIGVDLGARKRG